MSLIFTKTDREGRNTTYGCDPLNRLKSVTDPLNGRTLYGYDSRGNLTNLTDAEGRTTRFEYDRNNRLVKGMAAFCTIILVSRG